MLDQRGRRGDLDPLTDSPDFQTEIHALACANLYLQVGDQRARKSFLLRRHDIKTGLDGDEFIKAAVVRRARRGHACFDSGECHGGARHHSTAAVADRTYDRSGFELCPRGARDQKAESRDDHQLELHVEKPRLKCLMTLAAVCFVRVSVM